MASKSALAADEADERIACWPEGTRLLLAFRNPQRLVALRVFVG